jgi:hypothetical protein
MSRDGCRECGFIPVHDAKRILTDIADIELGEALLVCAPQANTRMRSD